MPWNLTSVRHGVAGCTYGSIQAHNGEQFPDPRDPCRSCLCQSGEVTCQPKSCPTARCRHPAMRDCCAVCEDCDYQGKVVMNGMIFNDPRDECRQCQCVAGSVECQKKLCGPVNCEHPVQRGCCQDCSACEYRGRQYSQGQSFTDPDSPCSECRCDEGTVTCQRPECPPVTCANPTQGACCPECRDCLYLGRTIPEGRRVPHTTDRCQECQCRRGDIACFPKECGPAQCRYPVQRECCVECSDCDYQGREYNNRQQFTDPTDSCSTCRCMNGNVICQQKVCTPVSCTHPVQGPCCQECSQCFHNNQVYDDGQRFPHLTDSCQTCQCRGGSVVCEVEDCSRSVTCSHPVVIPGLCCPVCDQGCLAQVSLMEGRASLQYTHT